MLGTRICATTSFNPMEKRGSSMVFLDEKWSKKGVGCVDRLSKCEKMRKMRKNGNLEECSAGGEN